MNTTPAESIVGHTPGPWRAERREPFVGNGKVSWYVEAQHTTVARVSTPSRHAEANAYVMAGAAELLEALKAASVQRDPRHRISMLVNDWERIERAIAKAEGRES